MNILVINHYAGSPRHGMEYRHFYLAREWTRLGHRVCIVAASQSHLHSRKPLVSGMMANEEIEGVRYFWLKTPKYEGNGIGRALNMLGFSLMLTPFKSRIAGRFRPDLVIASCPHPFVIYAASRIARASGAKLLFEVRDLWPLTLTELGGIPPGHPFIVMMQKAEDFAYRVSDAIISLMPKAEGYMTRHGMASGKFAYIPNGIDVTEWDGGEAAGALGHIQALSRLKQEGKIIVGFTGSHGFGNALDTLIEAAASLHSYPVAFALVGHGPEKAKLQCRALDMGLKNVTFLPPVPKASVPKLLEAMDILYIGLKKNKSLHGFGISPNKLIDYMMAGKPVIHAVNAGNDMVSDSGCGITVAPEEPEAAAQAVIKMTGMTTDERNIMGSKGKKYVLANHDYRVLARRFFEAAG
ncbi:MAG: glycosyltransferase family 4 protein [Nitrospiraceae bacterium]|nr:glycosyltransferase family 4 protein [Nitrospiraceae bacterium]